MATHDPIKHIKFLRQTLSQDKKPLGFFLSAGCPLAVQMPVGKWPLIPDVAKLTKFIADELKSKSNEKNNYDKLLEEVILSNKNDQNIEDILSFLRGLKEVSIGNSVRGFTNADLIELEKKICNKIVEKLEVNLPGKDTPYHKLANWISIDRDKPIEVFTTNYDLLLEEAFENLSIPYFDGFVGSKQSFFDLRAVEDNLIPNHWTRLWKIHGSINWFQKENKEVYRSSLTKENGDSYLIYPSHLKYEQSRKMPYLALIDQLNRFIRRPNSLLIITGYSFNDQHLNDTIISALKANPNSMAIALLYDTMTYEKDGAIIERYPEAVERATQNNLALWAYDEAIIGTARGKWKIQAHIEDVENLGNCYSKQDQQLKLGDFSILGNFLQALIGDNQSKLDEK
ncbi:SIR2 family protein [Sphingobacterium corticibacter]|uniref:SIR2 family protein n=1 Tax=Sphingobacterium corticibacter TaxID=2171749 RepID=A0A2T8HNN0_9SPHI|nr:SIR2 family protein [Sphingobacterium corticibacter]PVH27059.1 SIR2 family protein [Sphingobacterium corticibacter]